jgi:membrane protein
MRYPFGMDVATTLKRWITDLDRERARSFGRFVWHRFVEDRCFESAGALAYATLFALVPLAAVVFGIVSLFPFYETWIDTLSTFVFANFVPRAAETVADFLRESATNARGLPGLGAITLLVTALLTLASIEDTFNRIWRVTTPRRALSRVLIYWSALTLLPLLTVASLAISSYVASMPLLSTSDDPEGGVSHALLRLLPLLLEFATFSLAYRFIPNRTVAARHAMLGGLLATVLFEMAKSGFAYYLGRANYQQLYGAVAVIPIFLIWIYVSWMVVLLGASIAASLSAFRFQPRASRLPAGFEFFGLLRLLGRFAEAQNDGSGLHTEDLRRLEPSLTDDLLMRMLGEMAAIKVLQRTESGEWVLVRDLDHLSLGELYEAASLRVPTGEMWLPCRDDALGRRAEAALNELRLPLREQLKRSVATILRSNERNSTEGK